MAIVSDTEEVEMTMRPQVRRTESQILVTPELPPFVYKDQDQMTEVITKVGATEYVLLCPMSFQVNNPQYIMLCFNS